MNNYYLKLTDEAEFISVMESLDLVSEGTPVLFSHTHAIDCIGTIYEPTGNMITDGDGIEYPEMQAIPGYHVNYKGESLPTELQPFEIIPPATPYRVWA